MLRSHVVAAGLVAALAVSYQAGAEVIALYGFGTVDVPTWASSDADATSTASDLVEGPGIDGTQHGFSTGSVKNELKNGGNPPIAFSGTSNNFNENSFGDDDYLAFSITADSAAITLWDELTADWLKTDATQYSLRLQSSLTDNDADFVVVGDETDYVNDGTDTWNAAPAIDLSSLPDLGIGETRYFRLQISKNASNFDNARSLGLDNIAVHLVPEPAAVGLLGLGMFGLLRRRR